MGQANSLGANECRALSDSKFRVVSPDAKVRMVACLFSGYPICGWLTGKPKGKPMRHFGGTKSWKTSHLGNPEVDQVAMLVDRSELRPGKTLITLVTLTARRTARLAPPGASF